MSVLTTFATLTMDKLLPLPYFKGKGTIALSLLRMCKSQVPICGRTVNGARILLELDANHNSMLPYLIGYYERDFAQIFLQCVRDLPEGHAFVDIGANVGLYTCMATQEFVNKSVQNPIYAFEPNPTAFRRLEANIAVNDFKNVTCVQAGVTDVVGDLTLHVSSVSTTIGSLRHVRDYLVEQITVPVTTLDDYFKDNPTRIGILKADIEGGELNVLRGARNIIIRDQPTILFEENASFCKTWGHAPQAIHHFLQEMQYTLNVIGQDKDGRVILTNPEKESLEGDATRNILARPSMQAATGKAWH